MKKWQKILLILSILFNGLFFFNFTIGRWMGISVIPAIFQKKNIQAVGGLDLGALMKQDA